MERIRGSDGVRGSRQKEREKNRGRLGFFYHNGVSGSQRDLLPHWRGLHTNTHQHTETDRLIFHCPVRYLLTHLSERVCLCVGVCERDIKTLCFPPDRLAWPLKPSDRHSHTQSYSIHALSLSHTQTHTYLHTKGLNKTCTAR